jgi:hypothetical protein
LEFLSLFCLVFSTLSQALLSNSIGVPNAKNRNKIL